MQRTSKQTPVVFMAALALFAWLPAAAQAPPARSPHCDQPGSRALDFWVGSWTLFDSKTGHTVGTSQIRHVWGACALFEDFVADGGGFAGGSLVQWEPARQRWKLSGGGSTGVVVVFEGAAQGEQVVLESSSVVNGTLRTTRLTLARGENGTVLHSSDFSTDEGKTWKPRYAYVYRQRG